MPLGLTISVDYTRPPGVMARKWSDFTKAANQDVAEEWHEKYLPSHFAEYAQQRYRLQARAKKTIAKKERLAKAGHVKHQGRRPLIHSGLLEEQVKRRGILRVFPKRFTLTMPSHVPRRPRFSSILLHDEIVRVIDSENRTLAKVWKRRILKELDGYRPRKRVKL